jgi:hypothetical protein
MIPTLEFLKSQYSDNGMSAKDIAKLSQCSENKIHYWLKKYNIPKRSISDATYLKLNPSGNPFKFNAPRTDEAWFLYGLGIGLYWGEGNKANTHAVRLGNTDPALIKYFLLFLVKLYDIKQDRLRFGLQVFTDTDPKAAVLFWCKKLDIKPSQFHKTTITKQNKAGSYGRKLQYGVLTVYFSNRKLRDIIVGAIEKLQNDSLPM